jgi:hypothetical protein
VADEPFFPPPLERMPYRGGTGEPPAAMASASLPTIVARPEPPAESVPAPRGQVRAALSPAEIKALLEVGRELQTSRSQAVWKRGRRIVVPTGLVGTLIQVLLGDYALPLLLLLAIAAIGWTARPLVARDDWT